jgi:hypothetical protein
MSAGVFSPTTTGTAMASGAGGIWKNTQVLAWGQFDASGTNGGSYNVTGNASVAATSQYTITLTTGISNTSNIACIATPLTTDTSNGWTATALVTGSTTVIVTIWRADNTKVAKAFQFVIYGEP